MDQVTNDNEWWDWDAGDDGDEPVRPSAAPPRDDELEQFLAAEDAEPWRAHAAYETELRLRRGRIQQEHDQWLMRAGGFVAVIICVLVVARPSLSGMLRSWAGAVNSVLAAVLLGAIVSVGAIWGRGAASQLHHIRTILTRRELLRQLTAYAAGDATAIPVTCGSCDADLRGSTAPKCAACGAFIGGTALLDDAARDRAREDDLLAHRHHLRARKALLEIVTMLGGVTLGVGVLVALLINALPGGTLPDATLLVLGTAAAVLIFVGRLAQHARWRERHARTIMRLRETERMVLDRRARE